MTVIANAVREAQAANAQAAPRTQEAPTQDLSWTEVGPGLWVAKRGADFAGLIEKLWGAGYRATDGKGRLVGEFSSLAGAQSRVAV